MLRKRGPVREDERWFYNKELLDVVNDFKVILYSYLILQKMNERITDS